MDEFPIVPIVLGTFLFGGVMVTLESKLGFWVKVAIVAAALLGANLLFRLTVFG